MRLKLRIRIQPFTESLDQKRMVPPKPGRLQHQTDNQGHRSSQSNDSILLGLLWTQTTP